VKRIARKKEEKKIGRKKAQKAQSKNKKKFKEILD